MKKFKEIKTIKTIDLDTGKETTEEKEKYYTIKAWNELTTEEKEKEIEKNHESIYSYFQDDLYFQFKANLEYIKGKYNNISFDEIYFDSCSQGSWIESIKNFKVYYNIDIFGESIEVNDIDLHIRKYIDKITENDINFYTYYIDDDKLEKIENTKKFKKFINNIIKEVNNFIEDINKACEEIIKNEYNFPSNLNDPTEKEYLNNYFYDEEFIFEGLEN